jgi:hypothetical protein
MKTIYILITTLILFSGCTRKIYKTYDLPDNCYKSNIVCNAFNIDDYKSIRFNSTYVKICTDKSIKEYFKIVNTGYEYIIQCTYESENYYCCIRKTNSGEFKAFYYKWEYQSGHEDTFADTATVTSNLRPQYFKKLFPNYEGKLIIEDKDSILIDGTGLPKDLSKMIEIKIPNK